jgi:predicted ATPase
VKSRIHVGMGALLYAVALAVNAATALQFGAAVNVSQTPAPTEKAKVVRLAYLDGRTFRKAWLYTYGDGPTGAQNVYARASFDEGASWSAPILLSRDAANAPTGGQIIAVRNSLPFVVDNDKPMIYAPPTTSGPKVVIAWSSGYCPQDPAVANAGSYSNPSQGAGDLNGDGAPDRPYHCVWVATSMDPRLANWDVQQLTNGERDSIGEVVSGSSAGNAFALAWQEDPAGLQPGEAEGMGDGGSGANVTGGTNIWYTHAPAPNGAAFRANIAQLSDNNTTGKGQPGASRPNLQLSGSIAAIAYEETACPGGNGGKCIVYHSFPYSSHDTNSAGTIVSDVTRTSRRVRFVLQGASAAGMSRLRAVLLWRESPVVAPGAPADIIVRRGLVDTAARPGSTGLLPADILADAPQNMTRVAASGGNANAHRAIVRGSFIGLAYNLTSRMEAADAKKTATPWANYNLIFTRSTADGQADSWSPPLNLSRVTSPSYTVVEPRLVPTPGTIVNPLTGAPDAGDQQDTNVLYVAFATAKNTLAGEAHRVYVSRSIDQGASFEAFVPVSSALAGQSESQLRPSPDGSSAMALWMGEQTLGNPDTKDAMFAIVDAIPLPDLKLIATSSSFVAGGNRTVTLTLQNRGAGDARKVTLVGSLPDGLNPVGIGDPSACGVYGSVFHCAVPEVLAGRSRIFSVTVGSATEDRYIVTASVSSENSDVDMADNIAAVEVSAVGTAPLGDEGGGCTTARADTPFDPSLPLLAGLGFAGLALRRLNALRTHR